MAAALFRAGTGLSVRRIHREMCRVIWRPQTAEFSSKPSGRDPPRRTHIKKAKAQPAADGNKVLEKLFSEKNPGTAPPAAGEDVSRTAAMMNTSPASGPHVAANGDSLEIEEEKTSKAEAMMLESTLAGVKVDVRRLETEALQERCDLLEKDAQEQAKDTAEVDILTLDSVSETADALEAVTSVMLQATSDTDQEPRLNDEPNNQNAEKEAAEKEENVLEAMSLESVTLAEVEASLGTLESKSLSETSNYLEKEAVLLVGEKRMETEEETTSKEMNEVLNTVSLPEVDDLSDDLQTEALMEGLLFNVPGHVAGARGRQIIEEAVPTDVEASVDKVAAETDDCPAPPLKEELLVQEGIGEGAAGSKDGVGTHTDLDPVQRLFLEKIGEYHNMRRSNAGLLEAEPDYQKHLSEEMAKLQRLYGGGDLDRFPQFTFTNPTLDQGSK